MILIYAGAVPLKAGSRNDEDLVIRSKLLLHLLRNSRIVLPAVSITELLVPVAQAQKGNVVSVLAKRFHCPPFDLQSAVIASDLWSEHRKLPKDSQYKERRVLKADVMIIASAKAAGATDFYTHDRKCRTLASRVMRAHDLPKRDPTDMFAVEDIKRGDL